MREALKTFLVTNYGPEGALPPKYKTRPDQRVDGQGSHIINNLQMEEMP